MHTGVGFYGKDAADGGSRNVHLSGFAIEGDVRERIDTDQVNGIGGAMSDSTIDGLYIHHTKVGLWFDGPMTQPAGHQQHHRRPDRRRRSTSTPASPTRVVSQQLRPQHRRRRPGHVVGEDRRTRGNTFDHNTVQTPTLANGIAIYGGTDNTVSNNLVADPIREGSGIQVGSRFGAEPFTGHLRITDNTTVRAGTYELNWNIGLGAIWIYALEKNIDADIQVVGDHFLDNTYNAIMLVSDWPVKDLYSITNVHFKDIRVDGTGTSVVSARVGRLGARSRTSTPATSARSASTTAARSTSPRPARSSR